MDFYKSEEAVREVLIGTKFRGICWNKVCKKEVYDGVRFPEGRRYGEDIFVSYRIMSNAHKIMYLHKTLHYYRLHRNSAMRGTIKEEIFDRVKGYEEFIEWTECNYSRFSGLAYRAYSNIVINTTLMLQNADHAVKRNVMKKIAGSVRERLYKINSAKEIDKITKLRMRAYALDYKAYIGFEYVLKIKRKLQRCYKRIS